MAKRLSAMAHTAWEEAKRGRVVGFAWMYERMVAHEQNVISGAAAVFSQMRTAPPSVADNGQPWKGARRVMETEEY